MWYSTKTSLHHILQITFCSEPCLFLSLLEVTLAPLILPRLEFPVFCFFLVFWVLLRPWGAVLFCFPLTAALPCVPRPCCVDRPLFFMVAFFLWFWLATVCPVFFLPCFCGVCFLFACWALSFCAFIFLSFRCSFMMSSDSQCTREKKNWKNYYYWCILHYNEATTMKFR